MTLGKDYIKKELKWFGLLIIGVVGVEYLVLAVLNLQLMVQVFTQVLIGIVVMTATLRTGYRIWLINGFHSLPDNDNEEQQI